MNDVGFIVIVVGIVAILYFWLKPKSAPKPEDKLTNPIKFEGLPPDWPADNGGNII